MAAEGDAIITFIFNGQSKADIPRNVTHLIVHENITVIPAELFWGHPNLVEVYCHAGVTKIEEYAFTCCPSLRRVIIPGVVVVEKYAFYNCRNLIHVECDKLENIGGWSFGSCESLNIINFPSAKIVDTGAFQNCSAMTEAIFCKDLESVGRGAFMNCRSLESITIPFRNGLITYTNIFKGCAYLKSVNLVEGEALRDFTDALLLENWRNDMNVVLDSINQILSDTAAEEQGDYEDAGGKVIAIREWMETVLRKVIHHKAAHCELLNEAAAVLQLSLSRNAVINNVMPFIELPSNIVFDGE